MRCLWPRSPAIEGGAVSRKVCWKCNGAGQVAKWEDAPLLFKGDFPTRTLRHKPCVECMGMGTLPDRATTKEPT